VTTEALIAGREVEHRRRVGARKGLLTLHIVSAVGLLGSVSGLLVAGIRAATRDDVTEAHTIYELMSVLPFALGIPLSFIALGSGLLLGLTSRWGVLRHWWVTGKLALLTTTILVGALVTGPSIDELVVQTAPGQPGGPSGEWELVAVLGLQIVMVLTASTLAVFKPRGATPWGRRRA
jgi:hypothetical protein